MDENSLFVALGVVWPLFPTGQGSQPFHVTERRGRRVTSLSTWWLSTGSSSMTLIIFIFPEHFGHIRGSTSPDHVRYELRFSGSTWPSSFCILEDLIPEYLLTVESDNLGITPAARLHLPRDEAKSRLLNPLSRIL
jgi:hypothetical protein